MSDNPRSILGVRSRNNFPEHISRRQTIISSLIGIAQRMVMIVSFGQLLPDWELDYLFREAKGKVDHG